MISTRAFTSLFIIASLSLGACASKSGASTGGGPVSGAHPGGDNGMGTPQPMNPPAQPPAPPMADRTGPGADATDKHAPELGGDPTIVMQSKITLAEALAQAGTANIEAKFEIGDDKKLSLSVYPVGKGLATDAERNEFQELSGDPTSKPWSTTLDIFQPGDFEHLTRSARDLTLVQLSKVSLLDAVNSAAKDGSVYWAIPTIEKGRAGYGVYLVKGTSSVYRFIDGNGSKTSSVASLVDLGDGPGAGATDARSPEIPDLSVLATSKITMAQALMQVAASHGPMIEAKFEPNDAGNLSLSLYPVGKGITTDPENNEFQELSGEVAGATWEPGLDVFQATDFEHITTSTRDLTLVQTASITLAQAVDAAQAAVPGGFVYWAIPTIRDTRAGFGVYVYGTDAKVHYFFVS